MQTLRFYIFIVFWVSLFMVSLVYAGENNSPGATPANPREKAFQKLDKNHDQLLSPNEWKADLQTFLNLDCNKDQVLSHEEYLYADCNMDKKEIAFRQLDQNANGVIEFEEWQDSQNNFYRLDRDRNGWISRNEYFATSNTKTKILKQVLGSLLY